MLIDLSHTIEHGMITYKGLPAPLICDFLSREASRAIYAQGTEFHIGRIDMVANTGTYLDSPFHRFATGKDLADLSLDSLAGLDGLLVRVPGGRPTRPGNPAKDQPSPCPWQNDGMGCRGRCPCWPPCQCARCETPFPAHKWPARLRG